MEILLIRHGLPLRVENDDGTPADPPLSETGLEQARRVGDWLDGVEIDRIYASPMRRAIETSTPLATLRGLEVQIEPDVAEFDAQSELYIPMEELKATDYERWKEFVQGGYSGPEIDFLTFHKTVVAGVERIIADNAGRHVAVFCHGGVINAWATHVLGMAPQMFIDATYTSINRFMAASSGERSLVSLNETAHLRGMEGRAPISSRI